MQKCTQAAEIVRERDGALYAEDADEALQVLHASDLETAEIDAEPDAGES